MVKGGEYARRGKGEDTRLQRDIKPALERSSSGTKDRLHTR